MSDNDIRLKMIGKNLKRAREEKGLTQTELGDRVGVTDAQISKIERGSGSASIKRLIAIMEELDVSPETVFYSVINTSSARNYYVNSLAEKMEMLSFEDRQRIELFVDTLIDHFCKEDT